MKIFVFSVLAVFFWSVFVLFSFAEPTTDSLMEDHQFFLKDAYQRNYQQLSGNGKTGKTDSLSQEALEITASRMGISADNLQLLLQKTPILNCAQTQNPTECEKNNTLQLKDLATVCPVTLQTDLESCWKKISRVYEEEKARNARLSYPLKKYAMSSEVFTNGTLGDTGNEGFDLVVDLNVIDLILFGDKYSVPAGPSPFSRKDGKGILPSNLVSGTGVDYSDWGGFGDLNGNCDETNNENNNDEENTGDENSSGNGNSGNTGDVKTDEMCIDPDALVFRKKKSGDGNGDSGGSNGGDNNSSGNGGKCGEIVLPHENLPKSSGLRYLQYSYRKGGEYPDFGFGNGSCEADEKPLLGGWICVPEFCTEILCIKIDIIPGYRAANLSSKNCVECQVDKANASLVSLLGNIGKNTPNNSPTEPYFLTAFANLFRDIFDTITIKSKRLPFLIYDQSLTEQKKEKENPQTEAQKKSGSEKQKAHQKAVFLAQNKKLYDMLSHRCYPKSSPVLVDSAEDFVKYCQKYAEDEKAYFLQGNQTSSALEETSSQMETKNSVKSQSFHMVVKPFFSQLSADMNTINEHFYDIAPEIVQSKSASCDYRK